LIFQKKFDIIYVQGLEMETFPKYAPVAQMVEHRTF
jgi:hypothetical protein